MEVFEKNDLSCMISKKWENSQLNGRVISKMRGKKIKVAPIKRDNFFVKKYKSKNVYIYSCVYIFKKGPEILPPLLPW